MTASTSSPKAALSRLFLKPLIRRMCAVLLVALLLSGSFAAMASHAEAEPPATWTTWLSGVTQADTCDAGPTKTTPYTFDGSEERYVWIEPVDMLDGGSIRFWLDASVGGTPCETPDAEDDLVLEFSVDNGVTWTTINTYDGASYRTRTEVTENVPAGAQTETTHLRWRQVSHDGATFDVWTLADIFVTPSHSSALVTHDDFEDGFIDPVQWKKTTGAVETSACTAKVGFGSLVYPDGGGVLQSRDLPSLESGSDPDNVYRMRFFLDYPEPVSGTSPDCTGSSADNAYVILQTTGDGVSWGSDRTYYASAGEWYDVKLPPLTVGVRLVGGPAPWQVDEVWIGPSPTHATGNTADVTLGLSSAYTFPLDATVATFSYDSTILACSLGGRICPSPSEWRIILDGPSTAGEYSSTALFDAGGEVLRSGSVMHPGHGQTLRHELREAIVFNETVTGPHTLAVAVRAPEGSVSAWDVAVAEINVMDRNDPDADGVPEALESEICGRERVRSVFEDLQGAAGECANSSDFVPAGLPNAEHRVFVPERYENGTDGDNDSIPIRVVVHGHYIVLGTGAETTRTEPAEPMAIPLDYWDDNPNLPLLTYYCLPADVPTTVFPEGDEDGDGVYDYVVVMQGAVCVDRRPEVPTISFEGEYKRFIWPLDTDPTNENEPVPQSPPPLYFEVDTEDKLFIVKVAEDSDDDGIVAGFYYEYWRVRYNYTEGLESLSIHRSSTEVQPVDEDDTDRNVPDYVPAVLREDDDQDYVPDSAESTICDVEDQNKPADGECTILGDYSPPYEYQLVMKTLYGSF